MFKVYYTVYHRGSMKTIKGELDRSSLIDFLYEAKEKNISNISPDNYNLGWGAVEHVDINSLIEAVNEEGVLLIKEGKFIEW